MPIPPNAIDHPQPITILLAPARPLPAAPYRASSSRPRLSEVDAPMLQALLASASSEVRGIIGSTSTVGPNAARIGAPGILGIAQNTARQAQQAAIKSIGRNVDVRA